MITPTDTDLYCVSCETYAGYGSPRSRIFHDPECATLKPIGPSSGRNELILYLHRLDPRRYNIAKLVDMFDVTRTAVVRIIAWT